MNPRYLVLFSVSLIILSAITGCSTSNKSFSTNSNLSNSNNSILKNNLNHRLNHANTSNILGQRAGTQTGTSGFYKGLQNVKYSTTKLQKIREISQKLGFMGYIPDKMGGSSGYYIPGTITKKSSNCMSISFDDMTFYEALSWQNIKQSLSPQNGSVSILRGSNFTLTGHKQGQWYTLKYNDGARADIFVIKDNNTWIGIMPNPAKYTIPSLIQAVAESLQPISQSL